MGYIATFIIISSLVCTVGFTFKCMGITSEKIDRFVNDN